MAIAVSLRTVHFDVKDAELDSVSMGGQTQPRRVCSGAAPGHRCRKRRSLCRGASRSLSPPR